MWDGQGSGSSQLGIEYPYAAHSEDQSDWAHILNDSTTGFLQTKGWGSDDAGCDNNMVIGWGLSSSRKARSSSSRNQGHNDSDADRPHSSLSTDSGRDGDCESLYDEPVNNPVPDNSVQQDLEFFGVASGGQNQLQLTQEEAEAILVETIDPLLYLTTVQDQEGEDGQCLVIPEDTNVLSPCYEQDNATSSNANGSAPQPYADACVRPRVYRWSSTEENQSERKRSTDTDTESYSCYSSETDCDYITDWENYDDKYYWAVPR